MQDQNQMQIYPTMDGSASIGGGQQGPLGSGPGQAQLQIQATP